MTEMMIANGSITADIREQTDELIRRTFAAELTPGEGRTVDVRIVPYGERIQHNDGLGGLPKGVSYREEFAPGAFSHQVNAANRVLVNVEHEEGFNGVVGHGSALSEKPDGLYGSLKMHDTPVGEKALMLVREGVLNTVSLEARMTKSIRTADGVVRRVKADLVNVALSRWGAYKNAVVLGVREAAIMLDEELLIVPIAQEKFDRAKQLGIRLPQRFEAHPVDAGTPAESGTPEDGTRQADPNTSTEVQE